MDLDSGAHCNPWAIRCLGLCKIFSAHSRDPNSPKYVHAPTLHPKACHIVFLWVEGICEWQPSGSQLTA